MFESLQTVMRQFSIRLRMAGAVIMVLALFALFAALALGIGMNLQQQNRHFIEHSMVEQGHVTQIRSLLGEVQVAEKSMVIDYENAELMTAHRAAWDTAAKGLRAALAAMMDGEEDADNLVARDAIARLDEYLATTGKAVSNAQAGVYDSAKAVDRVLERSKVLMVGVVKNVAEIQQIVEAEAVATQAEIEASTRTALMLFAASLALVVVLVTPMTLINSRSIVRPIDEARRFAASIAQGDLSVRLAVTGRDEAAELMRALVEMQQSLQTMVGSIRSSAESISVASTEIASGNQDLSGRTEQTASNLQHAASSMEHLTGTVRQTADSARTANQLAVSAAEAAQRGGSVVSQVVTNMEEINASSKKIADIIGVIDGIAFQTNILALNAAVEAARAGEQGRGFAVVAGEVRNLAQRSANAAREIKSLIGASVDKVESGARLVHDAGSTMSEIVSSVQRVTDIIGEITAATTEQSGELGQVNATVNQLDQMTQQNAALVEQSAAAAESLKEQALKLSDVVKAFTVGSGAMGGDSPVSYTAVPSMPARPVTSTYQPKPVPVSAPKAAPPAPRAEAPAKAEPRAEPQAAMATSDGDWETF
ncbi:methyl-accepting chemotaxis sensory transducer [Leptothrix cholodnii SP-6]|uniref:Methyl-accepting chemotaxis sensory transducer n=1 Tax=Leptothrix cholodnii (strain ATCC 51168 / LMG 8142 / SP-6) TaxID=395495 RepID=B1XX86_LEPCP|nr:methyl-accepting chemotaxis protein [Leptothrix cholodnii]ACB33867.1 methyl-accepting chemotaxis sensory transducer [Leptothrix cholodnii SP-6]